MNHDDRAFGTARSSEFRNQITRPLDPVYSLEITIDSAIRFFFSSEGLCSLVGRIEGAFPTRVGNGR
jgi:hypothetical protein